MVAVINSINEDQRTISHAKPGVIASIIPNQNGSKGSALLSRKQFSIKRKSCDHFHQSADVSVAVIFPIFLFSTIITSLLQIVINFKVLFSQLVMDVI